MSPLKRIPSCDCRYKSNKLPFHVNENYIDEKHVLGGEHYIDQGLHHDTMIRKGKGRKLLLVLLDKKLYSTCTRENLRNSRVY